MKKTETNKEVYVYADWKGLKGPVLMGTLLLEITRGKEVFSFNYDSMWLNAGKALYLDPDLQMYPGSHYLSEQRKSNFGIFLDSSPDRWGRVLMQRREAALARLHNKTPQKLIETDYLLGVFDGHRMGGLRFNQSCRVHFLMTIKNLPVRPGHPSGSLSK